MLPHLAVASSSCLHAGDAFVPLSWQTDKGN
jgi:hypothetical protein